MSETNRASAKKDTALDGVVTGGGKLLLIFVLLVVLGFVLKLWGDRQESEQERREKAAMMQWACFINGMMRAHPERTLVDLVEEFKAPPLGVPAQARIRLLQGAERQGGAYDRDFVIECPAGPREIRVYSDGTSSVHPKETPGTKGLGE